MKPLVTTVRALKELATGLAPDAVNTSATLSAFEDDGAEYLISVEDDAETQRVILVREDYGRGQFVPESLLREQRAVIGRLASFAERARILPFTLPRGWNQYKHDNLIAFFAVPSGDAAATRWIAEVRPGSRSDVILWRTTTTDSKYLLEDFGAPADHTVAEIDRGWDKALMVARQRLGQQSGGTPDLDMFLPALTQSPAKGRSYDDWLGVISADQRAFVVASTEKSIRLRGPAGSGKTLALALKAVHEVLRAREVGRDCRVLITTHSWALATQVQDAVDSMGLGSLGEVDVFPLLEVAANILPRAYLGSSGSTLIGEDSYSGKRAQLDEIVDLLADFLNGDWVTFRSGASGQLRERLESADSDIRLALAWDLLIEFGSVIGPAAIFPGAGSELRYLQLTRAAWMLPLNTRGDLRVVYALYCRYMDSLEKRSLVTSDQVLADFLSFLETHAWNRTRKTEGYDLVFVDEFHLFNPLERQVIHYLTRDVATYPRVFMAVDPRQSPSEAFIGVAAESTRSLSQAGREEDLGDISNFELTTVHRFTPQILELVKHIHFEFPTLDLGGSWAMDISSVTSSKDAGPVPQIIQGSSRSSEETDIYSAVRELYQHGRLAIAVVDVRQWQRFSELAAQISRSRKFNVATIMGRGDVEGLGYRRRGLVVGPAEYLAGLQFDTVLVAGVPGMSIASMAANERTRLLSLLYLAVSRAEREVRVFTNEDDGGTPEVLHRGIVNGLLSPRRGTLA